MRRLPTLLVLMALGIAACGDDEAQPAATGAPGTEAPTTDSPSSPATDPATTEPASGGGGEAGSDALGPIPTGDPNSPWCQAARDVDEKFDELDLVDFSDTARVEAVYREAVERIRVAQRVVPPELEDALGTTLEGIDALVIEFEKVDWDFLDVNLGAIDTQALDEAGQELDRYNFYVCRIENGYDPDDTIGSDDFDLGDDQSIRDGVIEALVGLGLTEQQAGCVADDINFDTETDLAALRDLYLSCGVSDEVLGQLFGG